MKLVVFDLDGTLIDSVAFIVETYSAAFREAGERVPTEAAIRAVSGITHHTAMGILAPDVDPARLDRVIEIYRGTYRQNAGIATEPLFAGAKAVLDRLAADPETTVAVATGKGYHAAVTVLDRHGIVDQFHSIETPDHNRGKPDPQMLETAMRKAGVDATHTVMIGDTVHDMQMAKAAGVRAIGVAWGYHEVTDLLAAGADAVVESFGELEAAIDELLGAEDA